ncbi:OPT/YSL family transporter, partial [Komagataeibacter rhaeticus]|uniref:OPT/YSL family transporter n=1 Tax=Komagataeibacter rhaeticus TaxID=215221 RepID=UPI0039EC353E
PRGPPPPTQALAAPQPALLLMITSGIFLHQLDWSLLALGAVAGCVLIGLDTALRRTGRGGLPPLAVGIGVYLPMQVSMTLAAGALLSSLIRRLNPRAGTHRGTMIASGLIVGESLTGVALACLSALSGQDSPLSLLPRGVPAMVPDMAGLVMFALACLWFCRTQIRPPTR